MNQQPLNNFQTGYQIGESASKTLSASSNSKHRVCDIIASSGSACNVEILDDATVIFSVPIAANTVFTHWN